MQTTQELSPKRLQIMFAAVLGVLFCVLHLLNGWLLSYFEFSDHINLIYLPGFLRLANVLLLGLLWGSVATAIGGLMLMWWFQETWLIGLFNVGTSACVAALAVVLMEVLMQRRLSLRKLSDLIQLAALYALLNTISHHLMWSVIDPLQFIAWPQILYMVIGDLNGALIGAFALRWVAQHTKLVQYVRNLSKSGTKTTPTTTE
jgi:hypothetical protein